jgi:hypothetical protein
MTLTETPRPDNSKVDLDQLFSRLTHTTPDTAVGARILDDAWNVTEFKGVGRVLAAANPTATTEDTSTFTQVLMLSKTLTRRCVLWTWDSTSLTTSNRATNAIQQAGTLTIWTNGGELPTSPIHITAHLVLTRHLCGSTNITVQDTPGVLTVGSSTEYHVRTYSGTLVSQLMSRVLPYLTQQDFIRTTTSTAPPWRINAPMTLANLVAAVPRLAPDTTADTMGQLAEMLGRTITRVDVASEIVEVLGLEIATEDDQQFAQAADLTIAWSTAGGDPARYIDKVIRPILRDPAALVPALTSSANSVVEFSDYASTVVPTPTWGEVATKWHGYNITRIQLPRLRARLTRFANELSEILLSKVDPEATSITWQQAQEIAEEIGADVYQYHGHARFSLTAHREEIQRIVAYLASWPYCMNATEITSLTTLPLPLTEVTSSCEG